MIRATWKTLLTNILCNILYTANFWTVARQYAHMSLIITIISLWAIMGIYQTFSRKCLSPMVSFTIWNAHIIHISRKLTEGTLCLTCTIIISCIIGKINTICVITALNYTGYCYIICILRVRTCLTTNTYISNTSINIWNI